MIDPSVCPPTADVELADVELADVVRRFGPQYTSQYGHRMMPSQKKALTDIAACCTRALGGRLYRCDDCHDTFWHYHCCRNRACPKCHGSQARQWLQERQAELLPCDYFHAVATVPLELRALFHRNQKLLYGLLIRVAAAAVNDLCAQKRLLGALPGILAVLHTWNGRLGYHPHVHLLITGGGITPDGQHWEPARGEFLVPVSVLSLKIAAEFREALKAAAPALLAQIPAKVWQRQWVTFCKHYGHGNDAVLTYLSRYVFRTAISNARILGMDQTHVRFRWKDRDAGAWRTERLPGVEFLRRFLQHVLPRGFHKVRYYGLWHPSKRDESNRAWLLLILATLRDTAQPRRMLPLSEALNELTELTDRALNEAPDHEAALPRCPHCGSCRTQFLAEYPRFGVP
jgi:putative transposase/transposase-like zinc-binding protein